MQHIFELRMGKVKRIKSPYCKITRLLYYPLCIFHLSSDNAGQSLLLKS
jgi:hypothetical protein